MARGPSNASGVPHLTPGLFDSRLLGVQPRRRVFGLLRPSAFPVWVASGEDECLGSVSDPLVQLASPFAGWFCAPVGPSFGPSHAELHAPFLGFILRLGHQEKELRPLAE
eukprot:7099968-Heterocapsa_arctica.AAC.1